MSRLQKIEVTVNEAMSQAVAQFIEAGTVKSKGVNALETAVVQYIEAKRAIERLEKVKEQHRDAIESALRDAGGKLEVAGYPLSLVEFPRDTFLLKEAREKLDMRVLKPFIKTGMVSQIRVGRAL
jgi:hypothetical protein